MHRAVILNPKGGSGKSTVATNLAAIYASQGYRVALMDFDPQASSARWVDARETREPRISIIRAYERTTGMTRSWQLHIPQDTQRVVIDTPAGLDKTRLRDFTKDADSIIVPVLPSEIDIHAASRCIGDLLLAAKVNLKDDRIAVLANRVRKNTRVYKALRRFLMSLNIRFLGSLRDAQIYVRAAGEGLGICEVPSRLAAKHLDDWRPIMEWLTAKPEAPPAYDLSSSRVRVIETKVV